MTPHLRDTTVWELYRLTLGPEVPFSVLIALIDNA